MSVSHEVSHYRIFEEVSGKSPNNENLDHNPKLNVHLFWSFWRKIGMGKKNENFGVFCNISCNFKIINFVDIMRKNYTVEKT